jgi:1-deoxy-D-xylulose 5-phosphate reductoisomerase
MNKLWDDLKDNMKEWGVSAVEKAEEISRVAVAKGEEFTKISKLKFDILQLQKDKNKAYEKLGLLVYNKTNESNVSNFTGDVEYYSLIEEINKYSIEISEKDEEIITIKKEYGINDSDFEENYQSTDIVSNEEEE